MPFVFVPLPAEILLLLLLLLLSLLLLLPILLLSLSFLLVKVEERKIDRLRLLWCPAPVICVPGIFFLGMISLFPWFLLLIFLCRMRFSSSDGFVGLEERWRLLVLRWCCLAFTSSTEGMWIMWMWMCSTGRRSRRSLMICIPAWLRVSLVVILFLILIHLHIYSRVMQLCSSTDSMNMPRPFAFSCCLFCFVFVLFCCLSSQEVRKWSKSMWQILMFFYS